ncbi:MAG: hypothetical protein WD068_03275 [Candidatus Babeliales bacterium]
MACAFFGKKSTHQSPTTFTGHANLTVALGGAISIYGIWRILQHNYSEELYTSSKHIAAHYETNYIQERAIITQKDTLEQIIQQITHEHGISLGDYLDTLMHSLNELKIHHQKLTYSKAYIAHYHPDTHKIINKLAQLHNDLYTIKAHTSALLGLELCKHYQQEYSPELTLLHNTFPAGHQTGQLSLEEFSNESMIQGMHTIILQKFNAPNNLTPFISYFYTIEKSIGHLQEAHADIPYDHAAATHINQLITWLLSIKKFMVNQTAYIQEKEHHIEHQALEQLNNKIITIKNRIEKIDSALHTIQEKNTLLQERITLLEEHSLIKK